MRPEHISDALGMLSDEMLEQARTAGGKEKRMRRRKYYAALILVAFTVVVGGFFASRATAFTPQEVINMTFEAMGVEDAVFVGKEVKSTVTGVEYLHYTSDSTNCSYYFDVTSGSLKIVENEASTSEETGDVSVMSTDSAMSEEERREYVLDFAESCIVPNQIGELMIESEGTSGNVIDVYEIAEVYDGIQTGTRVSIICWDNGDIFSAVVKQGSVFHKNSLGWIELRNGDDFLEESRVLEIAETAVEEAIAGTAYQIVENSATIEMKAAEADLFYRVLIETVDDASDNDKMYIAHIDAYDGSVIYFDRGV